VQRMKSKWTLALVLGFLSPSVMASIKDLEAQPFAAVVDYVESTYLKEAFQEDAFQEAFPKGEHKYPIHILNRDEAELYLARQNALGDNKRELRMKVFREYLEARLGLNLTQNEASNLESYVYDLKGSAFALPFYLEDQKTDLGFAKHKVCFVFPTDASSNQRLEHDRLLGFNVPKVHGVQTFEHLKERMSFHELRVFSLIHEIGHCLDQEYIQKATADFSDPHAVHQSEAFAETFAALVMAREGYLHLPQVRAIHRSIYALRLGNYFAENPQLGFGDPNFAYGGLIYHLAPVLKAVSKYLDSSFSQLKAMGVRQLVQKSSEIVKTNSIAFRSFSAIGYSFVQGKDQALAQYKKNSEEMPELFAGAYQDLLTFYREIPALVDSAFNESAQTPRTQVELSPFQPRAWCGLFTAGKDSAENENRLLDEIYKLRQDLLLTPANPVLAKRRAKELSAVFLTLQNECKVN